jgi:hypothetical protein
MTETVEREVFPENDKAGVKGFITAFVNAQAPKIEITKAGGNYTCEATFPDLEEEEKGNK